MEESTGRPEGAGRLPGHPCPAAMPLGRALRPAPSCSEENCQSKPWRRGLGRFEGQPGLLNALWFTLSRERPEALGGAEGSALAPHRRGSPADHGLRPLLPRPTLLLRPVPQGRVWQAPGPSGLLCGGSAVQQLPHRWSRWPSQFQPACPLAPAFHISCLLSFAFCRRTMGSCLRNPFSEL